MIKSILLASAVSIAAMSAVSASEATLAADLSAAQSQLWSDLASSNNSTQKARAQRNYHKARANAYSTELDLATTELQNREDAQVAANIQIFEQQIEISELAASLTNADIVIANLTADRSALITERNGLVIELINSMAATGELEAQNAQLQLELDGTTANFITVVSAYHQEIATRVAQGHTITALEAQIVDLVDAHDVAVVALNEEIHSLENQLVTAFDNAASDLAEAGLITDAVYAAGSATHSEGSGAGYFTELSSETTNFGDFTRVRGYATFTTKTGETITESNSAFLDADDSILSFAEAQREATVRAVQDLAQAVFTAGETNVIKAVNAVSSVGSTDVDFSSHSYGNFEEGVSVVLYEGSWDPSNVIYTSPAADFIYTGDTSYLSLDDVKAAVTDAFETGYESGYADGFADGVASVQDAVSN